MPRKKIALLGSTGSIGRQTLEVIEYFPSLFEIIVLTAHRNAELLIQQALKFRPHYVVITHKEAYKVVKNALADYPIEVWEGENALPEIVQIPEIEIVVAALVGYAGFLPTLAAIRAKKTIALANKETLVVGGEIVMNLAKEKNVSIYPIDSEHSAIFQCLQNHVPNQVEKLVLTASGGPFRKRNLDTLENVTPAEALQHPNWNMGAKITIDSATMMNKGFELIEARWLFNCQAEKIDIVIHPQSVIHSMVQFCDSSILAQLGYPDMKLPIAYALGYPQRLKTPFKRFNFLDYPNLSFEIPDERRFPNLVLAFEALRKGGNMPCVLNAANEVSVQLFLEEQLSFMNIARLNEYCLTHINSIENPTFEDLVACHHETQALAKSISIKFN